MSAMAPSAAAIREVKEESDYDVVVKKLASLMTGISTVTRRCRTTSMKSFSYASCAVARLSTLETSSVDFFEKNVLPPLSLSRAIPSQIKHMFNHYRHPEWPTSFD